ncbi:unnamed protein product [Caenorhabditis angaria]|uniref:Ubiquitin-like domain-containing protein n=1 Tax=Caenorhabditis angaria TaxID=860376 RepID=A0A9P1IE88_9PELO|nr:unnamed protein product [Caenorhabditis angaria]
MDVIDISMSVIEINDKSEDEPSSCGCRSKCSAEVPYYTEKIQVFSPRIAALIYTITQKSRRFPKSEVLLWAHKTQVDPEIEHKIKAIHDFAMCPKILEYVGKFENWKEAVKKVEERLEKIEEDQELIEIIVKSSLTSCYGNNTHYIKVRKTDTIKSVKSRCIGFYCDIPKMTMGFDGIPLEDGETIDYYGMENGSEVQIIPRLSRNSECFYYND